MAHNIPSLKVLKGVISSGFTHENSFHRSLGVLAASWYTQFNNGGTAANKAVPPSGTFSTASMLACQRMDSTTNGSFYLGPDVQPKKKYVINCWIGNNNINNITTFILVDQVAYYPITASGVKQDFINTTAPNRYISGGMQVCFINLEATGSNAHNLSSLTYVNQNGVTGRLMPTTNDVVVTVSAAKPIASNDIPSRVLTSMGPFLPLASGDTVRSLTNATFSASNNGKCAFMLVKPISYINYDSTSMGGGHTCEHDYVTNFTNFENIQPSGCLGWMTYTPSTAADEWYGAYRVAWN